MAYLKKGDLTILNTSSGKTTALVTGIQWRRFKKHFKDKKTGEQRYKLKSVPYAICTISSTSTERYTVGSKMIIAGYKLRNHVLQGEKCLVLHNQYIVEFEKDGEKWVTEMIQKDNESKSSTST